jgi:Flp pilus assembly pilin Flp
VSIRHIERFLQADDGLEMVEWAVVGTAIVVAAAAVFTPLGTAVVSAIGAVTSAVGGS